MRTIDIATCCLAGFVATACSPDPDPQPDGGPTAPPATCAEIKARNPAATNGATTIFLAGDPARPVPIYCDDMGTDKPVEYLDLVDNIDGDIGGAPANVSVVYINNAVAPTMGQPAHTVMNTQFDMVRLVIDDPDAPAIDIGDTRHTFRDYVSTPPSTTFTHPVLSPTVPIDDVAYGVAVLCREGATSETLRNDIAREADIDLTSTPFALKVPSSSQPPLFVETAFASLITVEPDGKGAKLLPANSGTAGHCTWVTPRVHSTPLINPESGAAGTLPLRYVAEEE